MNNKVNDKAFEKMGIFDANRIKRRKSQASFEILILVALIVLLIIVIVFYMLKPKQEIQLSKAELAINKIVEYVNRVAEMDVGSKLKLKVEIPASIEYIDYGVKELNARLYGEDGKQAEIHRALKANVVGFFFGQEQGTYTGPEVTGVSGTPKTFKASPGTYDVLVEGFPGGVCIYTPGNRSDYCSCFLESDLRDRQPQFLLLDNVRKILCEINGSKEPVDCLNITYGSYITGLRSRCVDQATQTRRNRVHYVAYNWKNEVILDELVVRPDEKGHYNISDIKYRILNSDVINITATCYDECYPIVTSTSMAAKLKNDTYVEAFVPYGWIRGFIINKTGDKVYVNESHPYLINPAPGTQGDHLERGWVKDKDRFIIRTGYECMDGECIRVDASLWHHGYKWPPPGP